MSREYPVHDDFRRLRYAVNLGRFWIPLEQALAKLSFSMARNAGGVSSERIAVPGYRGRRIGLELFAPRGAADKAPCLLFIHGGGYVLPAAGHHKKLICAYALGAGCKVAAVDYGLAPRYPYPHAIEDCCAAYGWILKNAEGIGVDADRIGICGDSAGGGLAAVLVRMIRDRGLKRALFQMLIYPVIDKDRKTGSMRKYRDTPLWNSRLNGEMWKHYLRGWDGITDRGYECAFAAKELGDLPDAYVEVAEFDCLRDEGIEYHEKLKADGNRSELAAPEGTIHGFELAFESPYVEKILRGRIGYMRDRFGKGPR